MKKLLNALPLILMLAGCDLYFGGDNSSSSGWSYCGSDGYYQCDGNGNCTLESSTCPPGTDGGGGGTNGYGCSSNTDCAAGCYCASSIDSSGAADGVCEESGFCTTDSDCGDGYYCDTSRSTCEPTGSMGSGSGSAGSGSAGSGSATPPEACTTNADCTDSELSVCDTSTGACATGTCNGTVTTNQAIPTCPSGEVPVIYNGAYTGTCAAFATCSAASETPACQDINDETDCLSVDACTAVYSGTDCTNSNGDACTSGESGCSCATYSFNHCAAD